MPSPGSLGVATNTRGASSNIEARDFAIVELVLGLLADSGEHVLREDAQHVPSHVQGGENGARIIRSCGGAKERQMSQS